MLFKGTVRRNVKWRELFPHFFFNLNCDPLDQEAWKCRILKNERVSFLALENIWVCLRIFLFNCFTKSVESLAAAAVRRNVKWRELFPRFFFNLNCDLMDQEAWKCRILKIERVSFLALQNIRGCLRIFSFNCLSKSVESLTVIRHLMPSRYIDVLKLDLFYLISFYFQVHQLLLALNQKTTSCFHN